MLLIEYVGHIDLRSITDGHLGCHLEYFKTLNDARVASLEFIKYNAPTKKKTLKSSSRSFWFSTRLILHAVKKLIALEPHEPWHEISNNLTSVDSDEPVQPPVKLLNSKWCSVSSLTIIEYSSA